MRRRSLQIRTRLQAQPESTSANVWGYRGTFLHAGGELRTSSNWPQTQTCRSLLSRGGAGSLLQKSNKSVCSPRSRRTSRPRNTARTSTLMLRCRDLLLRTIFSFYRLRLNHRPTVLYPLVKYGSATIRPRHRTLGCEVPRNSIGLPKRRVGFDCLSVLYVT